jgi:uncharacterized protein YbaR (Trm112 family)
MLKKELLDVLACPKCKKAVRESDNHEYIVCDSCRLLYEIREGIPVMLIDEAKQVDDTSAY